MDDINEIPDKAGEQSDNSRVAGDIRGSTSLPPRTSDVLSLPDGTKALEFKDIDDIKSFTHRLLSVHQLFDDSARGTDAVARRLAAADSVFLEVGDRAAILVLDSVQPGYKAFAHVVVFNRRRLPDLENTIISSLDWAFRTFKLTHIYAWVPAFNRPAIALAARVGFEETGRLAGYFVYNTNLVDAITMSIESPYANPIS